jgi:hypothetical protein
LFELVFKTESEMSKVRLFPLLLIAVAAQSWAQSATTTTLSVSAASVAWPNAVTFTATVKAGTVLVRPGLVKFCNANASSCQGAAFLGQAQLLNGVARLPLHLPIGTYSIKAEFAGTKTEPASNSGAQTVTVTGVRGSATAIGASAASPYTLTATVSGSGSQALSGNVSFADASNNNLSLGTAALGAGTTTRAFNALALPGTGSEPIPLVIGNFNRSGYPDIIVANINATNGSYTLTIFEGTGPGTYGAAQTLDLSNGPQILNPTALAAGDFNQDGILDLAIGGASSNQVLILLGDGQGGFANGGLFPTGLAPSSIAVADFNRDGYPDLAVTNKQSSTVTILLGNGTGVFSPASGTPPATDSYPDAVAAADFDGDGIPDLAVANYFGFDVTILLGNGDGTFQAPKTIPVGVYPVALAAADLNGDGKQDLAVVNQYSKNVTILIGDGKGDFSTVSQPGTGNAPNSIAIADFNGDGIPDLAVANSNDNTVSLFFGKGDGTFPTGANVPLPGGTAPASVTAADLNVDGLVDLAVAGSGNSTAVTVFHTVTTTATAEVSGVKVPGGGTDNVIASYAGNSAYAASMSAPVALAATPITTTLALTAEPTGIVAVGEVVQLAATVSPSLVGSLTPGANVSFYNGTQLVAIAPVARATAVLNLQAAAGTQSYSAKYSGDPNFVGSASGAVSVTAVSTVATATTLNVSSNSATRETAVTLTAMVASGNNPVKQGTVIFWNANAKFCEDSAVLGKAQLTTNGTAVVHVTLPLGATSIKAVFSGATQFLGSVSAPKTVTVTASGLATTTTLALSGAPGKYMLTSTVTGSWPAPTGTVSFVDSSNKNLPLGMESLSPSAPALTQSAVLPVPSTMTSFAVADFNGDGKPDLAVANTDANSVSIFMGNGAGKFTAKASPINGTPNFSGPYSVIAGDFNADGIQDLAVTNAASNSLTILLGNGDGTFNPKSNPATGQGPTAIAAADFNGDGKLDVAVVNILTSSVTILLGNGDGTFTTDALTFSVGANAFAIVAADFNGDGKQDLAIANANSNNVTILLGIGDGSFTPGAVSPATGKFPQGLVVGDFNQDGLPDLATVNEFDSTVTILLNKGNGLFSPGSTIPTDSNAVAIAAADLNGDGFIDLAAVSTTNSSVTLLTGAGDGTFTTRIVSLPAGSGPIAIAVGDFNQDGVPDIVVGDFQTSDVRVLLNSATSTASFLNLTVPGGGTHQLEAIYMGSGPYLGSTSNAVAATGTPIPTTVLVSAPIVQVGAASPITVTVLPVSADNFTVTGTVTLYNGASIFATATLTNGQAVSNLGLPAGTYSLSAKYSGDTNFTPGASAATPYYVVTASTTSLSVSAKSVPSGTPVTLTASVTSGGKAVTHGVVTFFDGSVQLASADLTTGGSASVKLVLGIGAHSVKAVFAATSVGASSSSAAQTVTVTGLYPTTTTLTDSAVSGTSYTLTAKVTGASTQPPSGSVSFVNTTANTTLGTGALGAGTTSLSFTGSALAVGGGPGVVATGDFNRDGNLDLAVPNATSGTVTVLLGSGKGTFTAKSTIAVGSSPYGIAVADFNADGIPDLAVSNSGSNTILILIGNGDGTFSAKPAFMAGGVPIGVATGDFNLDGKLDLAVANGFAATVSVFLGNGDGTFGAPSTLTGFGVPGGIAVGDFNGDGKPDMAIADGFSYGPEILLGDGKGGFVMSTPIPTGFAPTSVAVGDYNGDGKLDVAAAVYNLGIVSVALGNGNGTFGTPSTISLGRQSMPVGVVAADFNHDGKLDLAVSESGTNQVAILLGNGDGTFNLQPSAIPTGTYPSLLVAGDFNGDGKPDIAVANQNSSNVSVLLNSLSTTATATLTGVKISGTANQNVQTKYPRVAPYAASLSNVLSLPPI